MYYRGWFLFEGPAHPVTGRWRARRFGVGMCANDKAMLMRMIDARVT